MINKKKIEEALNYLQNEIVEEGDYDDHYNDSDITNINIRQIAKDKLMEDLEGFELLDINLNDGALNVQRNEVINYIERENPLKKEIIYYWECCGKVYSEDVLECDKCDFNPNDKPLFIIPECLSLSQVMK